MLAVDAAHFPVPNLVEFLRSATTATMSVTLCHRLISALNKLPPQEQTRAVHLCAQIVGRKGSSWKLKHLDGLKSLVARMKKSANNDNDLKMGLEDVASEVIRARARRNTKVTDATPEDRVALQTPAPAIKTA